MSFCPVDPIDPFIDLINLMFWSIFWHHLHLKVIISWSSFESKLDWFKLVNFSFFFQLRDPQPFSCELKQSARIDSRRRDTRRSTWPKSFFHSDSLVTIFLSKLSFSRFALSLTTKQFVSFFIASFWAKSDYWQKERGREEERKKT